VLKTDALRQKSAEQGKDKQAVVEDVEFWSTVPLADAPPTHIAVSRDGLSLLVCVVRPSQLAHGLVFDVRGFVNKVLTGYRGDALPIVHGA
jgi:hypothetical protein